MPTANRVYSLSSIFRKAWATARHLAKHGGGTVRTYFAAALKQAWAAAKLNAQRIAEANDRVLAEVVRLQSLGTKEGQAKRAEEMAGWEARSGMPQRSYRRRAWR
jgi:hypothetical protein